MSGVKTGRILALVCAVIVAGTAACSTQAQDTAAIALPDCLGKPEVRPSTITFACADGNFRADGIVWTGWGATFAAGVGTAVVNDCDPYCAKGHFHQYPLMMLARGRQRCPDGSPAYSEVVYAFIGRSPYPQEGGVKDSTTDFPCKPMP